MKLKKKSNEDGFSLIEMIIAMICIVLLTTVSVASYTWFIDGARVRGAINIVMNIKKAVNDMSEVCNGYPTRVSVTDSMEFLTLIDTLECDPGNSSLIPYPKKYPDNYCFTAVSIGTMLGVESGGGTNALCQPACNFQEKGCNAGHHAITGYFLGAPTSDCSPMYGSAPFNGKSPGWNYNLLTTPSAPLTRPVAVICAVTLGRKPDPVSPRSPIEITVNTGGRYSGALVHDGTARFDINGGILPGGGCPCGPFCRDLQSGESGCCGVCGGATSNMGYKF